MKTILISLLLALISLPEIDASGYYTSQRIPLPDEAWGNWFTTDENNEWVLGLYESVAIVNNTIYTYEQIRKQDTHLLLALKDSKGNRQEWQLTPQAEHECFVQQIGSKQQLKLTRKQRAFRMKKEESAKSPFLRRDTAFIQGYIDGYDAASGARSGLINLSNSFTDEACPTVIQIHPNGCFEGKFLLNHPTESYLTLGYNRIPFYIEPGQTLTLYVTIPEGLPGSHRAWTLALPTDGVQYMGPSASLCQVSYRNRQQFEYGYGELMKDRETYLPEQLKEKLQPMFRQWSQCADSIIATDQYTDKAAHFLRNKVKLNMGNALLNFIVISKQQALKDTTNSILQTSESDDYYSFLRELPLHDETLLVNDEFSTFINRFEYLLPTGQKRTERLFQTQQTAIVPIVQQLVMTRSLCRELQAENDRETALALYRNKMKSINQPFLQAEVKRVFENAHPAENVSSHELPAGKATDIFRSIIQPHQGKLLLVSFWSTTCGPCRKGIEATAALRKQYKNHPECQFVYITSRRESSSNSYNNYVAKHLQGEASYLVSESDYHYLRELFRFNAVPHYRIIDKDGRVINRPIDSNQFADYLAKYFSQ